MRDRDQGFLVILFVAVAGVLFGTTRLVSPTSTSGDGSSPAAATASSRAEPKARAAQNDPLNPLKDLWDIADVNEVYLTDEILTDPKKLHGAQLDFLIVTVPDPVDTRFGPLFDQAVDAVQLALESQGYAMDHFWVPWRPSGQDIRRDDPLRGVVLPVEGSSDKDKDKDKDKKDGAAAALNLSFAERGGKPPLALALRLQDQADAPAAGNAENSNPPRSLPLHQYLPGTLVFRGPRTQKSDPAAAAAAGQAKPAPGAAEPERVLVVFLVGETPTAGVNKRALVRALNYVRDYCASMSAAADPKDRNRAGPGTGSGQPAARASAAGLVSKKEPSKIRVVAPFFSGASASLAIALREWHGGAPKNQGFCKSHPFVVRSGSAMRADAQAIRAAIPGTTFSATTVPHQLLLDGLLDYLAQQAGAPAAPGGERKLERIALLTETDTAYSSLDHPGPATIVPGHTTPITWIPFPFHISQVRAQRIAIEQSNPTGAITIPKLPGTSSRLHIPFDDEGTPSDILPSLSPRMTAVTDELVLDRILATLSREDFRYIGIVATDTRDTIFLASLIRQFCPDAQIISALQSDLLLTHPEYSNQLLGTLVACSYPLTGPTQRWTFPFRGRDRRHVFTNQLQEGLYNATLTQLYELRRDAGNPMSLGDELFDYGVPFEELDELMDERPAGPASADGKAAPQTVERRPPLWISVVSQQGLAPLAYYVPSDEAKKRQYTDYVYGFPAPPASPPEEGLTRPADPKQARQAADREVQRYLNLIPQYTWIWSAAFAAITTVCLFVCLAALRGLRELTRSPADRLRSRSVRLEEKFLLLFQRADDRSLMPESDSVSLLSQQEFTVQACLLSLAIFYSWVVLPCLIPLMDSPVGQMLARSAALHEMKAASSVRWLQWWNVGLWPLAILLIVLVGIMTPAVRRWFRRKAKRLPDRTRRAAYAAILIGVLAGSFALSFLLAAISFFITALQGLSEAQRSRADILNTACIVVFAGVALVTLCFLVATMWLRLFWKGTFGARLAANATRFLDKWKAADVDEPAAQAANAHSWRLVITAILSDGLTVILCILGSLAPLAILLHHARQADHAQCLFYFERVVNVGNGVSTLAPSAFIEFVFLSSFLCTLKRLLLTYHLYAKAGGETCSDPLVTRLRSEAAAIDQLRLRRFPNAVWRKVWFYLCLGAMVAAAARLGLRYVPTADTWEFTGAMIACLVIAGLAILLAFFRFLQLWRAIRLMLEELISAPMLTAFDRLPAAFPRKLGRYLDHDQEDLAILAMPVQQWQALSETDAEADAIEKAFNTDRNAFLPCDPVGVTPTRQGLDAKACALLAELRPQWRVRRAQDVYGNGTGASDDKDKHDHQAGNPAATPADQARAMAEDLVAMDLVLFVSQYTPHLRNLAVFLTLSPFLLFLAFASYPLQPHRFIMIFLGSIVAITVCGVIYVYVKMESNEFLSRVSKTPPNHVTLDQTFVMNLLGYLVPLLGVLVAQFPEVADTLNRWLDPMIHGMK